MRCTLVIGLFVAFDFSHKSHPIRNTCTCVRAQDGSAVVVVKRLVQSGGASQPEIREFMREIEALKDLSHPNVIAL
jgi:hypothetical protein